MSCSTSARYRTGHASAMFKMDFYLATLSSQSDIINIIIIYED